jgi:hypothetical protein
MKNLFDFQPDTQQYHARTGLIRIAHFRFKAFTAKFKREPGIHDPIFFDETKDAPFESGPGRYRMQLEEAARAVGIRLDPVLKLLGQTAKTKHQRSSSVPRAGASRRSQNKQTRSDSTLPGTRSPWTRFLSNERVCRRYKITRKERELLSSASFLGEARQLEDFLLVLSAIRGCKDR